jgi:4-amino-4-deoxy-L-arabinose transferase-like glycosyltransferase
MERPTLRPDPATHRLFRWDWFLIIAFATLQFSIPALTNPLMGAHETVHCVNAREMIESGDLIIPTYGGRVWLERPPLPFWITGGLAALTGRLDEDWPYRLGSMAMGLATVVLIAGAAANWFGRSVGLLTGLILPTIREFFIYATGSEADIFLAAVVASSLTLFGRAEVSRPIQAYERNFLGSRPWEVLAFFAVSGLLNLTKGLFFGTLLVGATAAAYLVVCRDWARCRRYLWLWGWLAYLAVSLPWPLLAWMRVPSVVELWDSDYLGRWNRTYMREAWWYYFAHLPWAIFPWTIPALAALWPRRTTTESRTDDREQRAWTLIVCWAVAQLLWLSIPNGKHHHYLLSSMPAWAVLSAFGVLRLRPRFLGVKRHWRNPIVVALLVGLPLDAAVLLASRKFAVPPAVLAMLLVGWPLAIGALWWAATRPWPRLSIGVSAGTLLACYAATSVFWDHCIHRPKYAGDVAFLERIDREVPKATTLFQTPDDGPLGASWWLHYLHGRPRLLQNLTFLRDTGIQEPEVYVIGRAGDEPVLSSFGRATVAFQSSAPRWDALPAKRWTLYRLQFHQNLTRLEAPPISALQATGRAPGPFLGETMMR